MDAVSWELAFKWAGYVGTALGGVYTMWRWPVKPIYRSAQAQLARAAKAIETVERIESEFHPNGGGSIRDQLNRIEFALLAERGARRVFSHGLPVPIFEADKTGEVLWVNRRFTEVTGLSEAQARGWGWVNALHPIHREAVVAEWEDAVQRRRTFRMEVTYQHVGTRENTLLDVEAMPLADHMGDVVMFVGIGRELPASIKGREYEG